MVQIQSVLCWLPGQSPQGETGMRVAGGNVTSQCLDLTVDLRVQ